MIKQYGYSDPLKNTSCLLTNNLFPILPVQSDKKIPKEYERTSLIQNIMYQV